MTEVEKTFERWYDRDPVVSKCVAKLEKIEKRKQHRVAAFLTDEIISRLSGDVYDKVTGETRKRRWYDFDEVCKIFMELLRLLPEDQKKEIAIKTIIFMEDNE